MLLFGQVGGRSVSLAALLVSLCSSSSTSSLSPAVGSLQKKLFAKVVAFWSGWRAFCVPGRPAFLPLPFVYFKSVSSRMITFRKVFCQSCYFFGRLVGFLCPWPPCLSLSSSMSTSRPFSCRRIPPQKKLFANVVAFWAGWRAFCVPGSPACLSVPVRLLQVPVLQPDLPPQEHVHLPRSQQRLLDCLVRDYNILVFKGTVVRNFRALIPYNLSPPSVPYLLHRSPPLATIPFPTDTSTFIRNTLGVLPLYSTTKFCDLLSYKSKKILFSHPRIDGIVPKRQR